MEFLLNFTSSKRIKGIIVDEIIKNIGSELNQDIISSLHVFSCRIYGLRKYKKKIERDEEIAKNLQSRDKTNNKTNAED